MAYLPVFIAIFIHRIGGNRIKQAQDKPGDVESRLECHLFGYKGGYKPLDEP